MTAKAKTAEFQLPEREKLDELCELAGVEVEEDALDVDAAEALLSWFNDLDDEEWNAMEKPLQEFSNTHSKALIAAKKAKKELVLVPAEEEEPEEPEEGTARTKPPAGKKKAPAKKTTKKEPTAAELKKMKAAAKEKASEKKTAKTDVDHIGAEWAEGSSAQECLDVMKAAGKKGITTEAAAKIAEKKIESSNPKGRVATVFRAAVGRELAKSEDGVYTYTGKAPPKKKTAAKKTTTTKRVKK